MKVRTRTLSILGAALALTLVAGGLYAAQADLTLGVDATGCIDSPPVFQEVNALCNVLSPGDQVLMYETGHFASLWNKMALRLGLKTEFIGLPGIDGYEVARRLRQQLGTHLTLVALTGWAGKEVRAKAAEAGFDYHIVKPVNWEELERIVTADGDQSSPR